MENKLWVREAIANSLSRTKTVRTIDVLGIPYAPVLVLIVQKAGLGIVNIPVGKRTVSPVPVLVPIKVLVNGQGDGFINRLS